MNDFNKSLEFKYPELPSLQQKRNSTSGSLPSENFRSDNLAVCLLILIGVIGLSYIPKSPFSAHSENHSSTNSPLTSNAYANGFPFLSSEEEAIAGEEESMQKHPEAFQLSASKLENGAIQFALEGAHQDWNYQLKIADLALLHLDQGRCDWQFDQPGIYSVELKAQRGEKSELLEIREVVIK